MSKSYNAIVEMTSDEKISYIRDLINEGNEYVLETRDDMLTEFILYLQDSLWGNSYWNDSGCTI